jgi:hypothetical protein
MDKDKAYEDFFRALRTALNNASIYFKDHPVFIDSIHQLTERLKSLFIHTKNIKVGIAPQSLFVEDKELKDQNFYHDIAVHLHRRKIKTFQITSNITEAELSEFICNIAKSPQDIEVQGGVGSILRKSNCINILVKDLDYSKLLTQEGPETKDVWLNLLRDAVSTDDIEDVDMFADNFDSIMRRFSVNDFAADQKATVTVQEFLQYLKKKNAAKFVQCAQEIVKMTVRSKVAPQQNQTDQLRELFSDLSSGQLGDTLWDEIVHDENFNSLSFKLFFQLVDRKKQNGVATSFADKVKKEALTPRVKKKIRDLFSASDDAFISNIYHDLLSGLLEEVSLGKGFTFDREELGGNYRLILLNLLDWEVRKERFTIIIEHVQRQWDNVIKAKDVEFLEDLFTLFAQKKERDVSLTGDLLLLEDKVYKFIEQSFFEGKAPSSFFKFLDHAKKSTFSADDYINKIFVEANNSPEMVQLFFKFHSKGVKSFYENLKKKQSDPSFLKDIVAGLAKVDSKESLEALKTIFSFANDFLKREVLRAMNELSFCDQGFLQPIFKNRSIFLKAEALSILQKDPKTLTDTLSSLFTVFNPLGLFNPLVIENIKVVEDANVKEAKPYLEKLSQLKWFWHDEVKKKALEVLEKWK